MPYDINEDPYVDKTTGVLRNKIGAKTQAALDKAEAEITYVIIATLTIGSSVGGLQFDSRLLRDVHKEIFVIYTNGPVVYVLMTLAKIGLISHTLPI